MKKRKYYSNNRKKKKKTKKKIFFFWGGGRRGGGGGVKGRAIKRITFFCGFPNKILCVIGMYVHSIEKCVVSKKLNSEYLFFVRYTKVHMYGNLYVVHRT